MNLTEDAADKRNAFHLLWDSRSWVQQRIDRPQFDTKPTLKYFAVSDTTMYSTNYRFDRHDKIQHSSYKTALKETNTSG